ncbi:unnamed protein product [Closterium sp. NIES-65]|nr:unnamed protein product [Closterium sp. NIES-65]
MTPLPFFTPPLSPYPLSLPVLYPLHLPVPRSLSVSFSPSPSSTPPVAAASYCECTHSIRMAGPAMRECNVRCAYAISACSSPTPTPTPSRIHHLLPKDSRTLWRRRTVLGATCAEADDMAEVCRRRVAAAGCPMAVLFPRRRASGGSDSLWLWMG